MTATMVGRADTLALLDAASAVPPWVVFVEGEAGAGKTRVVREWLAGTSTLVTVCPAMDPPVPWLPLVEVFAAARELLPSDLRADRSLGVLSTLLPELADILPACDRQVPAHDRLLLIRAMRSLFGMVGSAVVVVEDAQWLDPDSRDVLRWVAARPPADLRLVVTYRPEELASPRCPLGVPAGAGPPQLTQTVVRLPPLDAEAVTELAVSLGHPYFGGMADRLIELTGGLPGVLGEVLRPGCDQSVPPPGLSALVSGRMARLSGPVLGVARAAAVLAEPAGEAELASVAGMSLPRVRRALVAALRAGVLVEHSADRYGFRSLLAAQAGYALVPGPMRRQLHDHALQALNDRPIPVSLAVLARHNRYAGHKDDWLRLAEAAAEQSMTAGDADTTIGLLHDLLAEPGLLQPVRDRLAVRLSAVSCTALRSERSLTLLRRVLLDKRLPAVIRGELQLNVGVVLINQLCRAAEGRAELELVLREMGHDAGLAARASAALGFSYLPGSHIDTDREFLHRARQYAHACDDPEVLTAVLVNEATVSMSMGDPEAWSAVDQLLAAAVSTRGRQQVARGLCNVADAATWLGHHGAAERFLADGGRLASESGAPYDETTARGTALRLDWAQGRWDGLAARAAALVESVPDLPGLAADGQLVLGLLAVTRGDWSEARRRLEAAGIGWPDGALVPVAAAAAGAYLRILLATDDLPAATELAGNAVQRVRDKGIWLWAADLAPYAVETFLCAGRSTDAEALIAEFEAGATGADAPLAAAALELCRARLLAATEPDHARSRFLRAIELYADLPRPYEATIAAEEAAACQLAGDPGRALADLRVVADRFTALGSSWDAARCRHTLRTHGVTPAHNGGRPSFGAQLSPREQEVAVLAATGQRNRQIAEALYLSPRTVEQHVASAMRKLDIHTRGELSNALDRAPGQTRLGAVGERKTGRPGAGNPDRP